MSEPRDPGAVLDGERRDGTQEPNRESHAVGEAVSWRAVVLGALAGLLVVVPVSGLRAVLHHEIADFDESAWVVVVLVLLLSGFGMAGWVSADRAPEGTALMHGALAGLGTVVAWLPLRLVIWAAREDRGLVSGREPVLRPGELFTVAVLAAAAGMVGGWLARASRRARAGRPDE